MESNEEIRSPSAHFAYNRELCKALLWKINNHLQPKCSPKYCTMQNDEHAPMKGLTPKSTAHLSQNSKFENYFDSHSKCARNQETIDGEVWEDEKEKGLSGWKKADLQLPTQTQEHSPRVLPQATGEIKEVSPISNEDDFGELFASDTNHSYDLMCRKYRYSQANGESTPHDFHAVQTVGRPATARTYRATDNDLPYAQKSCSNTMYTKAETLQVPEGILDTRHQQTSAPATFTSTNISSEEATEKSNCIFSLLQSTGKTQCSNVPLPSTLEKDYLSDCSTSSLSRLNLQISTKDINISDNRRDKDNRWSLTYVASPTKLEKFIRGNWSHTVILSQSDTDRAVQEQGSGRKMTSSNSSFNNLLRFESSFYVKREGIQRPLQTHKTALKDDKDFIYNPYYAFLPEYTDSKSTTTANGINKSETKSVSKNYSEQSVEQFPRKDTETSSKSLEILQRNVGNKGQDNKQSVRKEFLRDTAHFLSYLDTHHDSNKTQEKSLSPYYTLLNKHNKITSAEDIHKEENMKTTEVSNGIQQFCSKVTASQSYVKKHDARRPATGVISMEQYPLRDANQPVKEKINERKDEKQNEKYQHLVCSLLDKTTDCLPFNQQEENKMIGSFCGTHFQSHQLQEKHTLKLPHEKTCHKPTETPQCLRNTSHNAPGDCSRVDKGFCAERNFRKRSIDGQESMQNKQLAETNKHAEAGARGAHCTVLEPPPHFTNQWVNPFEDTLKGEPDLDSKPASPTPQIKSHRLLQCQYVGCPTCAHRCIDCEEEQDFYTQQQNFHVITQDPWKRGAPGPDYDSSFAYHGNNASSELCRQELKLLSDCLPWGYPRHVEGKVQSGEGTYAMAAKTILANRRDTGGTGEKPTPFPKYPHSSTRPAAGESYVLSTPTRVRALKTKREYRKSNVRRYRRKPLLQRHEKIRKICKFSNSWSAPPYAKQGKISNYEINRDSRYYSVPSRKVPNKRVQEHATESMCLNPTSMLNTRGVKVSDYSKFAMNNGRIFLFSWKESDVNFKIKSDDISDNHSYALLHWSNSLDTNKCTRHVFIDLIRRIICEMKPLNLQFKSISSQRVRDVSSTSSCEHHTTKTTCKEPTDEKEHKKKESTAPTDVDCARAKADSAQSYIGEKETIFKCDSQFTHRRYFSEHDPKNLSFDFQVTHEMKKRRHPPVESNTVSRLFNKSFTLEPIVDILTQTLERNENTGICNFFASPSFTPYPLTQTITNPSNIPPKQWNAYLKNPHTSRRPMIYSWWYSKRRSMDTARKLFDTLDVFCVASSDEEISSDDDQISWFD